MGSLPIELLLRDLEVQLRAWSDEVDCLPEPFGFRIVNHKWMKPWLQEASIDKQRHLLRLHRRFVNLLVVTLAPLERPRLLEDKVLAFFCVCEPVEELLLVIIPFKRLPGVEVHPRQAFN